MSLNLYLADMWRGFAITYSVNNKDAEIESRVSPATCKDCDNWQAKTAYEQRELEAKVTKTDQSLSSQSREEQNQRRITEATHAGLKKKSRTIQSNSQWSSKPLKPNHEAPYERKYQNFTFQIRRKSFAHTNPSRISTASFEQRLYMLISKIACKITK